MNTQELRKAFIQPKKRRGVIFTITVRFEWK
jgi:hypothetical protein